MWCRLVLLLVCSLHFAYGFDFNFTQKSIRLKLKQIKCEEINYDEIEAMNCTFKPTKNGGDLTTLMAIGLDNIDELWITINFFHKMGQKFIQVISTWDLDWCGIMENSFVVSPFTALLIEAVKISQPSLFHACPYDGEFGVESFNVADAFENAVPQVVPTGIYKSEMRYYRKSDNVTYVIITGEAEISAVDVQKSYRFG